MISLVQGFLGGFLVAHDSFIARITRKCGESPQSKRVVEGMERSEWAVRDGFLIFCGVLVLKELTIFPFSNL